MLSPCFLYTRVTVLRSIYTSNKKGKIRTSSKWVVLGFLVSQHISYGSVMKDFLFPSGIFGAIHLIGMCSTVFPSCTWNSCATRRLWLNVQTASVPFFPFLRKRRVCRFIGLVSYDYTFAFRRLVAGQLRVCWKGKDGCAACGRPDPCPADQTASSPHRTAPAAWVKCLPLLTYVFLQELSGSKRGAGWFAIRSMQINAFYLATLCKMRVRRTSNRKALIAQH